MQPEISDMLTQIIIPAVSTVLLILLSYATKVAISWINEHTKGKRAERLTELMSNLEAAIDATVTTAQETIVKGLKTDGKFTAEEAAAVKQGVIDSVMRQAGPIVQEISDMGVTEIGEVLHNMVEQSLAWRKSRE